MGLAGREGGKSLPVAKRFPGVKWGETCLHNRQTFTLFRMWKSLRPWSSKPFAEKALRTLKASSTPDRYG
jgi:hypothetical protein